MKKKILLVVMSICVMLFAWGCAKKDVAGELNDAADKASDTENTSDAAADTEDTIDTAAEAPTREAYNVDDYITLGDYKGLAVSYTKLEVTDKDVDNTIQDGLKASATQEDVTDRPVQEGDTVNIDYEGLKDGVAFDGGTAQGYNLEIGSDSFINGFEDGLIGANIGDKVSLDLTFPENYTTADLAGQAVVFNVTINSIKASAVPELTEEYVKENTDYDTVEAYKKATRTNLEEANENTMKNEKISHLLSMIIDGSTISSYPQTLIDYYKYTMKNYYTQYASMYGYELSDFLTANNITEEAFDEQTQSYAENSAAQEMVLNAVINAEGIELSDEEYKEGLAGYIEDSSYDTEEEFFQHATEEQVRESLLWEKTINYLLDNSVIA